MTVSPASSLPLELLEEIFRHLHSTDRPSLAICLQVNHQFHDIAGSILYRRIETGFILDLMLRPTGSFEVLSDHSPHTYYVSGKKNPYTRKYKLLQSCGYLTINPHHRRECQKIKGRLGFPNLKILRLNWKVPLDKVKLDNCDSCFDHGRSCSIISPLRPKHMVVNYRHVCDLDLALRYSNSYGSKWKPSKDMNDFFESIENLTVLTTVKSVNCNSPWRYRSVNDLRNLKKVTVIMIHNKMENHKLALDNFASTALRRLCQNKSIHSIRVVNLDKVPCGYWNPITGVIDDELIKSLENHDRIKDPFLLDSFHTSEIWDEEAWDISDSEEMRVQKMVIEEGKRQLGKIELLSAQEYLGLEDSRGVLEMEEIKALLGDI